MEVIKEYLNRKVAGQSLEAVRVVRPTVVRSLAGDLGSDAVGRRVEGFERRGKFLLVGLSGNRTLAINPMLTGALQHCEPKEKVAKRTCVVLGLSGGRELRYLDEKQMGMLYWVDGKGLEEITRLEGQGPDVLSPGSFEEFKERMRPFYGEIKGVLTNGRVMAGIGNAYADEILFAAGVYPFKKARSLSEEELRRIYEKSREVVEEAIGVLRERVGDDIHEKVRDFLKVHNKGGEGCPGCGGSITEVRANQRITSYCRRCQPGLLIRN
jgi:formamidopyrimidine-DNA glycosylase